jgi:CTP synthase (UTP-ammonia lyase)
MGVTIGLIGDRDGRVVVHRAIPRAFALAGDEAGIDVELEWLGTETIDPSAPDLSRFSALWCVPGSPYRSTAGALAGIRFAREHGVPFLGTCGGFQHALIEVASSLWGVDTAGHAELDPSAQDPVIAPLACKLLEEGGTVHFRPGSKLAEAYGELSAVEEYHCGYGFNVKYAHHLEHGPLRMTSWDDEGDIRGVELEGHPFFVATLFQPERAGLKGRVPPIVRAYLAAVTARLATASTVRQDRESVGR